MTITKTEKWVARQFFIPPSLDRDLDQFVDSSLKEGMADLLDNDHGYIPKHGWKSRIVVKAIKEFLAARRSK